MIVKQNQYDNKVLTIIKKNLNQSNKRSMDI